MTCNRCLRGDHHICKRRGCTCGLGCGTKPITKPYLPKPKAPIPWGELTGKVGRPREYDPTCTFPGCARQHRSGGLCSGHYKQRVKGAPLTLIRERVSHVSGKG